MSDEFLNQAITLAKQGQTTPALFALKQHIRENPKDVRGWWMLANMASDSKIKQESLKRVLALDASHQKARTLLAQLEMAAAPAAPETKKTATEMPEWATDSSHSGAQEVDPFGDVRGDNDPFPNIDPFAPAKAPPKVKAAEKVILENIRRTREEKVVKAPQAVKVTWVLLLLALVLLGITFFVIALLMREKDDTPPGLQATTGNPYLNLNYPQGWQAVTTQFNTIVLSTRPVSTGDINPYGIMTDLEIRSIPSYVYSRLEYWTKYYWDFDYMGDPEEFADWFRDGLMGGFEDEEIKDDDLVMVVVQTIPYRSSRSYSASQVVEWTANLFKGELEFSYFGVKQAVDLETSAIEMGGLPATFTRVTVSNGYTGYFGANNSYSSLYFASVEKDNIEYLFLLSAYEANAGKWEQTARHLVESISLTGVQPTPRP